MKPKAVSRIFQSILSLNLAKSLRLTFLRGIFNENNIYPAALYKFIYEY